MLVSKRWEGLDPTRNNVVNTRHEMYSQSKYQPTSTTSAATGAATSGASDSDTTLSMGGTDDQMHPKPQNSQDEEKLELRILCFDLKHLPAWGQFLVCCGGVFFFYLIYGYFQELIFHLEGFKPFGWYLTLLQFALYTCFSLMEHQICKEDKVRKIPLKTYSLIAFLTVATMGLSNSSLGYLNYPTQVIFKSCKLIPVLIGGIVIQSKRYGVVDVLACLFMSVGLIFFTLADSSVSPTFSLYGVLLISLALCADAVIGNVQEKVMKQYSASNTEMVLYSYAIGTVYIFIGQLVTGQLFEAFTFCLEYPLYTYGNSFIFALSGYLGVNIVLNLIKTFGALIAVTVTTCRKSLTIIFSFLFFAKPFTYQYVWSGLIVILGIYLNIYSKNRAMWDLKVKQLLGGYITEKKISPALRGVERIV